MLRDFNTSPHYNYIHSIKRRKNNLRLYNYDYNQIGLYFITICTKNRLCIFGEIIKSKMVLNEIGKIIYNQWKCTETMRENILLDEFIVMPNHFHAIIAITNENHNIKRTKTYQLLPSVIRGFKGNTTKLTKKLIENKKDEKLYNLPNKESIWHRGYHDHIIRNQKSYQNIKNYIQNNPINWEIDKFHN